MKATTEERPGALRRLAWFGGLWLLGVAAVALLAYGLRFLFGLA
jgi:hypothetical protein